MKFRSIAPYLIGGFIGLSLILVDQFTLRDRYSDELNNSVETLAENKSHIVKGPVSINDLENSLLVYFPKTSYLMYLNYDKNTFSLNSIVRELDVDKKNFNNLLQSYPVNIPKFPRDTLTKKDFGEEYPFFQMALGNYLSEAVAFK